MPIDAVRPDPRNPRLHDERNLAAIRTSLQRFGQQKPIVIDRAGVILAGNGQHAAAVSLGWTHLAVVRSALAGADGTAFAIADNRTAELAAWDQEALAELLNELAEEDAELVAACGFDGDDLAELLCGDLEEGLWDADDVPAPPAAAVTRPGDLIELGHHRLLCGDSAKPQDVDRLLGGASIHLVNTDPPYNVKVEPRSNNAIAAGLSSFAPTHHQGFDAARRPGVRKATHRALRAKDRPLMNDFISDADFEKMLAAWFGNLARVLAPGRTFYIWGGYANVGNYPPVLRACELYFSQAIIWVKGHPVLTRKDFMGDHEWCFYGWRLGAGHRFFGPNNVTDVWPVKKVNPAGMIHLTEKPVELAARAIGYSSRPGENVLDLFGGSGSTLIACEQAGRQAWLMELDPLYCDVIVERWERFSGRRAKRPARARGGSSRARR